MKWIKFALCTGLFQFAPMAMALPSKAQNAGDLGLTIPAWTVVEAPDSGPKRSAVIVQGSYRDPQLFVEMIRWSVEGPPGDERRHGLRAVLEDTLGFDSVDVLTDRGVSKAGLRNALQDAFSAMKGPGNVLYLHWIGHGFEKRLKDGSGGDRHFYTYSSDESDPYNPTETLSVRAITQVIKEAKEAWLKDAEVEIAICYDACASDGLSRGQEVISMAQTTQFDLEAFSAGQGKKAKAETTGDRDRRSGYTGALADHLHGLGVDQSPVDLRRAFEHAAGAVPGQRPSMVGNSVMIFAPKVSMLRVRVVSSEDRYEPLATARVELPSDGRDEKGGDIVFRGLRVPGATGYRLRVTAPGYRDREITVKRQGKLLTVPLVRDFDLLRVEVLARPGAETMVEVVGDAAVQMGPIHHRSRTARGSQWLMFAIPTGLERVELEARSEGAADVSMGIDMTSLVAASPEGMRAGASTLDARERNQLVDVDQYTASAPLFVSAERIRLEVRIKQPTGTVARVSVVGSPGPAKPAYGPQDLNFEVAYDGRDVVLAIQIDDGEPLIEIPFSLASPRSRTRRGQATIAAFSLEPIDLEPKGRFLAGEIDLGGEAGTVTLSLLPDSGSGSKDFAAGDFAMEVDPGADPDFLHVASSRGASKDLPIDLTGGVRTYFEGRVMTRIDLGRVVLDASAQGGPTAAVSAPVGFWEHLLACEEALDRRDIKSAKKSIAAARKLLPLKRKDERYVFIDYYKALSDFVEAGRYKAHTRDSWFKKARGAFEKICKGDSEQRDMRGVSPRAMSRYYVGYIRARDLLVAPTKTANRNADAAFEALQREFPNDNGPDGQGLVQRLQADIDAFKRKLSQLNARKPR